MMKKFFLCAVLCAFTLTAFTQDYSILPEFGKVLTYSVKAKTPMGEQQLYSTMSATQEGENTIKYNSKVSQTKGGDAIQDVNVIYNVVDGKYSVALKEALASTLSQLGECEVVECNGALEYPVVLSKDCVLNPVSMKIKASIQGMDLDMDLSYEDRTCVGEETITVPAGTYECLKFQEDVVVSVMGQDQVTKITSWYAKGIGLVKQLTDAMQGAVTTTMELEEIK